MELSRLRLLLVSLAGVVAVVRGKLQGLLATAAFLFVVNKHTLQSAKPRARPWYTSQPFVPLLVSLGFLSRGQRLLSLLSWPVSSVLCWADKFELPDPEFLKQQLLDDHVDQGEIIKPKTTTQSATRCLRGYSSSLMSEHSKTPNCKTVHQLVNNALVHYKDNQFMGTRVLGSNGEFQEYKFRNYTECLDDTIWFVAGLIHLFPGVYNYTEYNTNSQRIGADPSSFGLDGMDQSKLGYYGRNSEELCCVMLGCLRSGIVCVPVYDTLGENSVQYVIKHSGLKVLCVSETNLDVVQDVALSCPCLEVVIVLPDHSIPSTSRLRADTGPRKHHGVSILPYSAVLEAGRNSPKCIEQALQSTPQPKDVAFIMYTSGTTGTPKGVVLTQGGFVSAASGLCTTVEVSQDTVHLSYLPMAHCFEIAVQICGLICGASVGFFHGDVKALTDDAVALKPTIFIGVPRVYQRVQQVILQQFAQKPWPIRRFIYHACYAQVENARKGYRNKLYDLFVFSQVKKALGGKIRIMCTGSAPLSPEMTEFIRVAFDVPLVEGYGMTETHGICNTQHGGIMVDGGDGTKRQRFETTVGNVGPSVGCSVMKLESVKELGYSIDDEEGPRGEVLIGGVNIFSHYYKDPTLTEETKTYDGFLRTGDIGRINKNGSLSIIDRRKNMFKLSQGEYVAAEVIELNLMSIPYIGQIFVHGDSTESYLVAVVVPDPLELIPLMKRGGVKGFEKHKILYNTIPTLSLDLDSWLGPFEKMCTEEPSRSLLCDFLLEEIRKKSRASKFRGFEVVKKIHIEGKVNKLMQGFSVENDLLTPTFKLKRSSILCKYKDVFQQLYSFQN